MIVPMKKISVVCLETEKTAILETLGAIGTVHIHQESPQSPALDEVKAEALSVQNALQLLAKTKEPSKPFDGDVRDLVKGVLDLQDRVDSTLTRIAELNRLAENFKNWGDFSPSDLEFLGSKKLFPMLYSVPTEKAGLLDGLENKIILSKDRTLIRVMALQDNPEANPGLDCQPWPELSPSQAKQELALAHKDLASFKGRLHSLSIHGDSLKAHLKKLNQLITWESAKASFSQEDRLAFFTGYVPVEKFEGVRLAASITGFGLLITDPGEDDAVPTKVKNGLIPRIIAPVFDLLGTVPGYRERDISLPFLLYFIVFFGMIMGDAGYGALFLVGGLLMAVSSLFKRKKIPDIALLLIVLSSATVVWGALTATWFGDMLSLGTGPIIDFLKSLSVKPFVDANFNSNPGFVKWICFALGATQLIFAHLWNFIGVLKTGNVLKSLAQLGGLVTTAALYPVVLGLVITGQEAAIVSGIMFDWLSHIPLLFNYMYTTDVMLNLGVAGVGIALVILFGNQEGNFFKGLADGLGNILNTALGAIGWFSDNISYIRLFAVGLAGFAIAQSFNGMGMGVFNTLGGGVLGFSAAALVMFLGHSLNVVMALLGVVVHGVRLNMLEFSSRLGMEWIGFEYNPLTKITESKS